MDSRRIGSLALVALVSCGLHGCASTRPQPATEWDGLVLQSGTRLDRVWVKPGAEIAAYRNVMLDPVEVGFARNWDPNRSNRRTTQRLDAQDVAAIRSGLADLFRDVFRTELARSGYRLVDEPGAETLRVTAAIVNLYLTAPETRSGARVRTYTASSGSMTLVVELRDSITGDLLARAVDTQTGRTSGVMTVTNRATNTADARRAIGVWAAALRRALDGLHAGSAS